MKVYLHCETIHEFKVVAILPTAASKVIPIIVIRKYDLKSTQQTSFTKETFTPSHNSKHNYIYITRKSYYGFMLELHGTNTVPEKRMLGSCETTILRIQL